MSTSDENKSTPPTTIELKTAFKAFKRRLKLAQLDEDSSFGRSPLSGGRKIEIVAISPPGEFSQAVWDELVKQKKLKKVGRDQYALATE